MKKIFNGYNSPCFYWKREETIFFKRKNGTEKRKSDADLNE